MSRVHDALRRASQDRASQNREVPSRQSRPERVQPRVEEPVVPTHVEAPNYPSPPPPPPVASSLPLHVGSDTEVSREDMEALIHAAHQIPYNPQRDALVVNI